MPPASESAPIVASGARKFVWPKHEGSDTSTCPLVVVPVVTVPLVAISSVAVPVVTVSVVAISVVAGRRA